MGYWAQRSEDVLEELASSTNGLTTEEADARIRKYGLNNIPIRRTRSTTSLLASQVLNPLIIALIVAAGVSALTGGVNEAAIIAALVATNIGVGFAQEHKSEQALQRLIQYIRYRAKAVRNGEVVEIDTRRLTLGDLVVLETGDRVPADLRLIETDDLDIDESLVTGESYPVHKTSTPIPAETLTPSNMVNVAFMGTLVVNGKGKGVVVATGLNSTFGSVVGILKLKEPETNYQENIARFSRFLVKVILVGVTAIFLLNALTGKHLLNSALFSLALAVGVIPETLPIIITIGLSRGAIKMSRRGVIVKKLSTIEDLGNMDVLCADKTGTLTENHITLIGYLDLDGSANVELVKLASACVSVMTVEGRVTGNPIDVAIVEYVNRHLATASKEAVVERIPFDYFRRQMSAVIQTEGRRMLVCKGAPESMFTVCSKMKIGDTVVDLDEAKVRTSFEAWLEQGYRVIGFAVKEVEAKADYGKDDERDMTMRGLLYFNDPLNATAKDAIARLNALGVTVKILTGDNATVAKTIASQAGVDVTDTLTGNDLDAMSDAAMQDAVDATDLFARLTPAHKARIVATLKQRGHVTGFLGDGVNDAPALRFADVGMAVEEGVDIAKEAADIILSAESLEPIVDGIVEGRTTFSNTTKYILNTVSANMGNMATLAIISVILEFLPMLPFQVLLTNLMSDGPLLSISTDSVDPEELVKPKNWDMALINRFTAYFGGISSLFDFITIIVTLWLVQGNVAAFRTAWFIESTLSEILVTFAIRTKKKFYESRPSTILAFASLAFGLGTLLLPYSSLNVMFELAPLDVPLLSVVAVILSLYFIVVETAKHGFYTASSLK